MGVAGQKRTGRDAAGATAGEEPSVVRLTVDGGEIEGRVGDSVLDVCRANGVHVPTLCHDPRLESWGACRLCIVEIEGIRGFPTSCTTPAADGMVVTTKSDELERLRRTVVELLLSDHKLDCVTCDRTGQCALQDIAYDMGIEASPYEGEPHAVGHPDPNPLIERDYDRCIQCGRCVRICAEVQGCDVYGYVNRGFDMLPDTPYERSLTHAGCEFCGQCVSTCPVGALMDRTSRFRGRPWQLETVESTCGYCGVGCTIQYRVKDGVIVGATAPLDRGPNGGNLCAKGRYGYSYASHPDRLTTPLVRRNGELEPTTWDEAIAAVAAGLEKARDEHGPDSVGGLASAKCTNEENYLFQKLLRAAIGTHNIDHCARL
jgi:NADH dehydrogenase/NADH:ubiquinone oxidoreductase subunit G